MLFVTPLSHIACTAVLKLLIAQASWLERISSIMLHLDPGHQQLAQGSSMTGSYCSSGLRDLLPGSSGKEQHLKHLLMHDRGSDDQVMPSSPTGQPAYLKAGRTASSRGSSASEALQGAAGSWVEATETLMQAGGLGPAAPCLLEGGSLSPAPEAQRGLGGLGRCHAGLEALGDTATCDMDFSSACAAFVESEDAWVSYACLAAGQSLVRAMEARYVERYHVRHDIDRSGSSSTGHGLAV